MAEITRRRTGELLRKLFELLLAHPGGLRAREALAELADSVSLTDYENGTYTSGDRRFEKIVRFATVDCVKAGWLAKSKGHWEVTEVGRTAFAEFENSEAFYREACRLYSIWKARRDALIGEVDAGTVESEIGEAAETLNVTFEEAEEQAWAQIEAYLKTSDPFEFQEIVADLLEGMEYHVSWISPPGKDGGVDIIAYTDPLGAQGPRIKVQVKRWQSKVDTDGLRSFLATINGSDIGLFVCLAGFTKDAESYARSQETRRITLIDAERLVDLWIDHYDRLDDVARQRLTLTPIYFLTPPK
ncbi:MULTISPECIES: restriction endonuclease [unclassified Mesorhizobium]|uniref:restriction endonuclease n=1 Tax=unclassified Mesorhizobium TaxID=325217 RepID=UPI000FC99DF8|nr:MULTISPECIES: restriction endonuclease [unclassified Mesorhizobium]RUV68322.1 Mrr restriction system protein [Mesorhizobium sp. M5C.F.Cr.IN.023.01.1.1]RWB93797.1 MAG: Mrr restriction system protein [Mesorhizobium sp.]RWE90645.1 MAG: Mrr restriction system protein [Mesorhizobium sp.]RWJ06640.1 MAG: Mrr restriction system protein [Mesorhizobium sp.]RWJ10197.1 MAG: Mrr restriction system protein [Mesorhizobium sp.]